MYNNKSNVRKVQPEKPCCVGQQDLEENFSNRRNSSRKQCFYSFNVGTMKNAIKPINYKNDAFEASSSCGRENCQNEPLNVCLKDVGVDIAGFLIEEEIKQNKEILKREILKQIALSRELDIHLERQRHIMNNYICYNSLDGTLTNNASNFPKNIPESCICKVCQEAAIEEAATCNSAGVSQPNISGKSYVCDKSNSTQLATDTQKAHFVKSAPTSDAKKAQFGKKANLVHSTPVANKTKKPGASTQDIRKKNSNLVANQSKKLLDIKELCQKDSSANNAETVSTCSVCTSPMCMSQTSFQGYIEKCSSSSDASSWSQIAGGETKYAGEQLLKGEPKNVEFSSCSEMLRRKTVAFDDIPMKIQKLSSFASKEEASIAVTDQLLSNINTLLRTPLETIKIDPNNHQQQQQHETTENIICNIKCLLQEYLESIKVECEKCDAKEVNDQIKETENGHLSTTEALECLAKCKSIDISLAIDQNPVPEVSDETTRIDVTMKFNESNKKKPHKNPYTESKKSSVKVIKPLNDNTWEESCSKCASSKNSQTSKVKSKVTFQKNSRKFSPYPSKERTSYPPILVPGPSCHLVPDPKDKCPGKSSRRFEKPSMQCPSRPSNVEPALNSKEAAIPSPEPTEKPTEPANLDKVPSHPGSCDKCSKDQTKLSTVSILKESTTETSEMSSNKNSSIKETSNTSATKTGKSTEKTPKTKGKGVVIVSPLFEARRIQLIQNWLAYIHKLQAKEHFKTIAPAIVAIKVPTSSRYVLPNEESDYQLEFLMKPKTFFHATIPEKDAPIDFRNEPTFTKLVTIQSKSTTSLSSSTDTDSVGSSFSDVGIESSTSEIITEKDISETNHDYLIQELISPSFHSKTSGRYFNVSETDKIIKRAFYIQDIFVKLANTEVEKEHWRKTVLRVLKCIVTKT